MTTPNGPHTPEHSHATLLPRLLELDGEIHSAVVDEAITRARARSGDPDLVRRVLDIGAGVGTGTVALARRFPAAEVVAIDIDEQMLARVRVRALSAGLAMRITTVRADIGSAPLGLGAADIAWASAALHEVVDPDRALRTIADALRPGGLLVVMEMDAPPFVLPASYAEWEAGLRRAGAVAAPAHPDWTSAFRAAGFDTVEAGRVVGDQVLPATGPAGEYAALELRRIGHAVASTLPPSDRERLVRLAGDEPGGVRDLRELWIRGSRTVWTARRP